MCIRTRVGAAVFRVSDGTVGANDKHTKSKVQTVGVDNTGSGGAYASAAISNSGAEAILTVFPLGNPAGGLLAAIAPHLQLDA